VLQVDRLAKQYGEVVALSDLSLDVASGTTLVLLGQNGAGKTTALRCMSGLLKPSAGRVRVGGVDSATDPDAVRAQVGLVPEVPGLYDRMSAWAYLDYFGRVYELDGATRNERIGRLLELFGLADAAERWLGTFSKGMRQKVALIRATMHRPRLVLADEPTSALDPDSARVAWAYLEELRAGGAALVVCTHNMEEAQALAGEIGIMARGRLLAAGDLHALTRAAGLKKHREVVERPTLEEIYLAIVGNREEDEARPA
jgi:ABC-2 type transport system ATP-binding protein